MKILLVEDARAIAAVMEARLSSFGHKITVAENGQIAVDKFQSSHPDLVLMDIEMPIMNGFEATNLIRTFEATQKWAWTPIIFLTASDTPESLIMAIEAGGDDFLSKSISEEVLHAKMKALSRIADMRHQLTIANLKLEQQASRDGLTGLFNRRWMDLTVNQEWESALQKNRPFGVLMLDVDNFKKYNDHYGHQAGDDCLKAVATAIEDVVTEINSEGISKDVFAARYGGEEFAIVMPGASNEASNQCAARVIGALRKLKIPHEDNSSWGIVTASIGGSHMNSSADEVLKMFLAADQALYRAKEGGRNRFEF